MQKTNLLDKYPVLSLSIDKKKSAYKNVGAIIEYFKDRVESDKVAKFIGIFNHYEHTQNLESGSISEDILDAQVIVFCFGQKIPNPLMLAVRPRSIAVVETDDTFVISFMEAPMAPMSQKMQDWVEHLIAN